METKNQNLIKKPPVVVVLGHIDHGKTSLLNAIRKLQFTEEKPGGTITQHIGAYQIERDSEKITFIDTPGHEAFSAMRARGAKVADIAILVVDAVEGVKEQTKEAISAVEKAAIPLIVALNKIDKKEANPEKVKRQLAKVGVLVEDLGGEVPAINVSAKTGEGISDLLEMILLVGEMEKLETNLKGPAEGVVIEAYLDRFRGPTATLILNRGVLKKGEIIATSSTLGKVKNLEDFQGKPISKAFPSQPVILLGFEKVPQVGEKFKTFSNLEEAKSYLKIPEKKEVPLALEIKEGQKVLNLILKTDVLGSIEAIGEVLGKISSEKVVLRILKSEVGEINESDVKLAKGAEALILGFRVKINPIAKRLIEREKVRVMVFEVIYDLVEGVRKLMEKLIEPEVVRIDLGKVKVLIVFRTEKNRQIVGGRIIEGEVKKGTLIEILREGELVGKGRLINLQKNRRDIEKAGKGEEVGILYEGKEKIKEDDLLVIYLEKREKPKI